MVPLLSIKTTTALPPSRFERPGLASFVAYLASAIVIVWSLSGTGWSFSELARGLPAIGDFLSRAWPPDVARLPTLLRALVETFQMALIGTLVGALFSLPLGILAARGLVGGKLTYVASRGLIALFRTVPDLIWALLFVISVGLGPFAGTLALTVDTIGFCGRFFAEAMEEVDQGPREALTATGARSLDVVACAVVPAAMPSFLTATLFALEKATRSSVILGLVGAGGIGLELKVAMDLFEYPLALTIIAMIFVLVLGVERVGAMLRARMI